MIRCFTLCVGLFALVMSGCDDKSSEEIADVIVLSRNSAAFSVEGGTTSIAVASPSEWTASCPEEWVTLTPDNAELLKISVTDNSTDAVRDATVVIKTAADEKSITIHQAYSRGEVYLSLTSPTTLKFDSEGEQTVFTVVTNGEWSAEGNDAWLTVSSDKAARTVTVVAGKNTAASRQTKLNITARYGTSSKTIPIDVSQISLEENPYYNILGYYGLYAKNWYYDGKALGVGGTGAFCTIEQKEYRKSVYIKNLFIEGTVVEAAFNKEDGTLSIELGKKCLVQQLSPTVVRTIFLTQLNMAEGSFHGGTIAAKPGKGANDDGEIRDALLLSGFESGYKTLGLTVYQGGKYASFSDVYYATGTMYFVRWDEPSTTPTAVQSAAAAVTPTSGGLSAYTY